MTTPGQLVQVMADVLGISKATIIQYDRVLSEHGLRSKHGRGTSAAQVTSRDAANLLTAIAASSPLGLSAKKAVEICKRFSALVSVGPVGAKTEISKLGFERLVSLPDGHSFGKALAALIEWGGEADVSALQDPVVVQFIGPIPEAQIFVGAWPFGHYVDKNKFKRSSRSGRREPGLVHASSVRTPTIRALGALVLDSGIIK